MPIDHDASHDRNPYDDCLDYVERIAGKLEELRDDAAALDRDPYAIHDLVGGLRFIDGALSRLLS